MTGSVTMFGGASGLPSNLVDQLMAVEQARLSKMQASRAAMVAQKTSFDTLSSKLLALKSKAHELQQANSWTPRTGSSSDATKVGVTASSDASAGIHTVEVQRLASSNAMMSSGITKTESDAGITTITDPLSFTYNGNTYNPALAVGDTLQKVADKINALNYGTDAGVSASVLFDGTNNRLVMTAKDSGALTRDPVTGLNATSRIDITAMDITFDTGSVTAATMTVTNKGEDAQLTVDGLTNVYSSSNTVSGVLSGITMNLQAETTSPVTLTVGNDTAAAKTTLQGFVDSYNDALDFIASKKSSDFSGESTIRSVISQIRMQMNTPTSGVSGLYDAISQMGVETDAHTGKLSINADKFDTAINNDFSSLQEIFSSSPITGTKGLAYRMEDLTNDLTKFGGGAVTTKKSGLTDGIKRMDDKLAEENRRLDQMRIRLTKKYAQLEQSISMLTSSGTAMSAALSKM